MMGIDELIKQAAEKKASEIYFIPGDVCQMRSGREWKPMGKALVSAAESKQMLVSALNEVDRQKFFETGFWKGIRKWGGLAVVVQFQQADQGISGHCEWSTQEAPDFEYWGLPAHLPDILTRTQGLSLLVGPSKSRKEELISSLLKKIRTSSPGILTHVYKNNSLTDIPSGAASFSLDSFLMAEQGAADLVVVEEPMADLWPEVLRLSESGRHVVMSMTARNLMVGLERWRSFHKERNQQGLLALQMGIGCHRLTGIETESVHAVELLLVQSRMREALGLGHWDVVVHEMKTQGEKTGMRTLNQSLLQLLLKRKVDLRSAFHESPHPEELDELLKKVGI